VGGQDEATRFVRGEGRYTDDLCPPDALRAVFVRSPHAHADIVEIDTAAARAMGATVITGADVAQLGSIAPIMRRSGPDGSPMALPPRPPLTADRARYVGDPVALVLAETRAAAEDAAEAVAIEWDVRDAVTDIARAVEAGAPLVWDEAPGNLAYVWAAGDAGATEAAIAGAAHVSRLTVAVTRTTAAPMEPRAATAFHDAARDHYTLRAGVQAPWQTRGILAKVLGIAPEALTVTTPDVGGSFGMKGQTFPEYAALLHAARLTGRPVHWLASRSEAMASDDQGRDVVYAGTLALDAEGRFVAVELDGLAALGAYLSTRGTLTAPENVPGIIGPYRFPTAAARLRGVYTNTASISPYRGAGRPEASLLIERLVDTAARETGRDPVALRTLNLLEPGELPHVTPLGFRYDSGDFPAVLEKAVEACDRAGFPARRAASEAAGRLRGLGVASVIARASNGQFESARVTLRPDGTALVECGAVSHGQGHASTLASIAARRLCLPDAALEYRVGSSDQFDAAVGTFGSRTAGTAGPAILAACEALLAALVPDAALQLNADIAAVTVQGGAFHADGRSVSVADLALRLAVPLAGEGRFAPEGATFPNGAHVCEVEVDPATGAVDVVAFTTVEDVGHVLNAAVVKAQVHGGIVQGLGQALAERIVYDGSGQLLTGSFMDFALPRASDVPAFTVVSHPVPTAHNPLGVKGAGEGGTIGALPAFQNALADALAPLQVRNIPMPATPDAVWRLIDRARKG
jgi:carbon-monoxide dehydrogenase large subunit